jgi:cystinosin
MLQVLLYRKRQEKLSVIAALACSSICIALVVLTVLCLFNWLSWLNLMYTMSYIKLVLTIIKCMPQVYMNYLLKSTVGWHIQNVILDLIGGVLSITQLFLDAFSSGDMNSGIKG